MTLLFCLFSMWSMLLSAALASEETSVEYRYDLPSSKGLKVTVEKNGISVDIGGLVFEPSSPLLQGQIADLQPESIKEIDRARYGRSQKCYSYTLSQNKDRSTVWACQPPQRDVPLKTKLRYPIVRIQASRVEDKLSFFFPFNENYTVVVDYPTQQSLLVKLAIPDIHWLGSFIDENENLYLIMDAPYGVVGAEEIMIEGYGVSTSYWQVPLDVNTKVLKRKTVLGIEVEMLVEPPKKNPSRTEFETWYKNKFVKSQYQVPEPHLGWRVGMGAGYQIVDYQQNVVNNAKLNYQDFSGPGYYFEASYRTLHWGGLVSYKSTPGSLENDGVKVDKSSYLWQTLGLEGLYYLKSPYKLDPFHIYLGFRAGAQFHRMPFLRVNPGADLTYIENQQTTGSLGFIVQAFWRSLILEWTMRYQTPIATQSSGEFIVTPTMAFDGSVGVSYRFSPRWESGIYWYGQLHSYGFTYQDGIASNTGTQSLFYSTLDLRLSYLF